MRPAINFTTLAKKKYPSGESRLRPDARCPPGSLRTPGASEFSFIALWHPLHCNTPHFCSFLCRCFSSPRPPLTPFIYLLPSSVRPMTSHSCSFLCGSVRSPLSPQTPFIFLLTHFPSPHNPSPLPNTPSAVLRTHPAPYLPTLPYTPLYAWR